MKNVIMTEHSCLLGNDHCGLLPLTYTIDDALAHGRLSRFNITVLLCSSLMWFNASIILLAPAVLPGLIQCFFGLTATEHTVLVNMTYVGYFFGNLAFGSISDKYGRKKTILLGCSASFVNAILFAFSPSYLWTLMFEFTSGFFCSAIVITSSLCVEFMPPSKRSWTILTFTSVPLASGYYSLLAWVFLESSRNWNTVLLLGHVLPFFLGLISFAYFVPESPRFLLTKNEVAEADAILRRIWKMNKVKTLPGKLAPLVHLKGRGSILGSFKHPYLRSTLLISLLWFVNGMTYYGGLFIVTNIGRECLSGSKLTDGYICKSSTGANLLSLVITSMAELPGALITVPAIDRFGRKTTLWCLFVLMLFGFVPLLFCKVAPYSWIPLFFVRGAAIAVDSVLEIYAPEVYPTYFRNAAVNSVKFWERVGIVLSPYIADLLLRFSIRFSLGLMMALVLLSALAAYALPKETADCALTEECV